MAEKKEKKDLHSLTIKELENLLKKSQEELVEAKMKLAIGKLKNVRAPFFKRKQIARIKTVIAEKQLMEEEG